MDNKYHIPEQIAKIVPDIDINQVDLYICSDMDLDRKYNPVHFIVFDKKLYVIEKTKLVSTFLFNDLDDVKIEYNLTMGVLYFIKDNKRKEIAYFSKEKSKDFAILQANLIPLLKGEKTLNETDKKRLENSNQKVCPKCHTPYEPGQRICKKCNNNKNMLKRLISYDLRYKKKFILVFVLLGIASILTMISPILSGQILYNEVLSRDGRFFNQILLFVIVYLLIQFGATLVEVIMGRVMSRLSNDVCYDLKVDVFKSMQQLSLKYFQDKETGELLSTLVNDADNVYNYLVNDMPYFVKDIIQIVALLGYLLVIQPILTLFVLIPLPFVVIIFVKFKPRIRQLWEQNRIKENKMVSMVSDTLEGFRVVKVFSGTKREVKKFENLSKDMSNTFIKQRHFNVRIYPISQMIISVSLIVAWGLGGYFVIKGSMDYGTLMTFITGLNLVYSPLEFLVSFLFDYTNRAMNCARRIFEIMDSKPDIIEKENPVELDNIIGRVEFRHVSFAYEANNPILSDISFALKENTSLGIVGKTGVGKTTIVNLLARLYDVDSGEILIDGINVKDLSLKSLHKHVSMISQDTYLFKGSILDNIRFARPEASFEEVIEAAKIANAHEFIMKLPRGYDTLIGEGEINLSGGERQRISIARAVLLNSKIIIFDEATAAMDTKTEKMIQESIYKLQKDKTVIMIAHRLSTLKDADRLIIIENKRIVESGTMAELIKNKKQFYELYSIQKEALKHIGVSDA